MSRAKKVFFPKIRLQEMLTAPGGMARSDAIEAAVVNLRAISGEGDRTIEEAIVAIERIMAETRANHISHADMGLILGHGDQIVTLAGTFDYVWLDRAARGLCDVADGLMRAGLFDAAPLAVHARAMRLFSPLCKPPTALEADMILAELEKVMAYYNLTPITDTAAAV